MYSRARPRPAGGRARRRPGGRRRPGRLRAAVAAAREGASACLVERYPYLGGLASGGMVLVLDDMCDGAEITVRGICAESWSACAPIGLAVYPPEAERGHDPAMLRKWSRWGLFDFNIRTRPHPICYAVAFDPDGWKRASDAMVQEAGIDLRLHSQFSRSIVRDGRVAGVVGGEQGRPRGHPGRRGDRRRPAISMSPPRPARRFPKGPTW